MLLKYRTDQRLADADWHLLEFNATQPPEIIKRRITQKTPSIFGSQAVEFFFYPEFLSQGWILVRSLHEHLLAGLQSVHGLNVNKELLFDKSYVEQLVEKERADYLKRIASIAPGSFVWIRDGFTRDYCGTVEGIDEDIATVEVQAFAIRFVVKTPVSNLEDLSFVPESQKSFFTASIRRI